MDKFGWWIRTALIGLLVLMLCVAPDTPRAGEQDVAQLNQAIASHNSQAGLLAAWRLQISPGDVADSFPTLIGALDDPDWRIRWLAARALGVGASKLTPDELIDLRNNLYTPSRISLTLNLWKLLGDPEPEVRRIAAQTLLAMEPATGGLHAQTHYGSYGNQGGFLVGLGDEDSEVSYAMVKIAVVWLERPHSQITGSEADQQKAKESHASSRRTFVQDLASYLSNKPNYETGIGTLELKGREQYAEAIQTLEEERKEYRRMCNGIIQIFHRTKEASALGLIEMMQAEDDNEVSAALSSLRHVFPEGKAAIQLLVEYLNAGPGLHTTEVITALQHFGSEAGAEAAWALIPYIKDLKYVTEANKALKEMDTAVATVIRMRDWPWGHSLYERWEREEAVNALGSLGFQDWTDPGVLMELYKNSPAYDSRRDPMLSRRLLALGLKDIGAGCVSHLLELIELAKGEPIDEENILYLLDALLDCYRQYPEVRQQINGLFFGEGSKPEIIRLIDEELSEYSIDDGELRYAMLKHLGHVELVALQPSLLADRQFAAEALPTIISHLSDTETRFINKRRELYQALKLMEDQSIELALGLIGQTTKDSNRKMELKNVIIGIQPDWAPHFIQQSHDDTASGYDSTLVWLAQLGPAARGAAPLLLARILDENQDWRKRRRYAETLAKVGPQDVVDPGEMIRFLKDVYKLNPRPIEEREPKINYRFIGRMEYDLLDELKSIDLFANSLEGLIAAIGEPAVAELINAANGRYNDQPSPLGSLSSYGNPEYDVRLRRRAFAILGEVGPAAKEAVPLLLFLLADPRQSRWGPWYGEDPVNVSLIAAEALGKIGVTSDEVLLALLDAANSDDLELRTAAVEALNRLRNQ